MYILRVENLTHTYSPGTPFERNAIENINLNIPQGEMVGIIGHTGSGKSTLIQHFNGLLKPTSGAIYLEDQDIWGKETKIRDVRFQVGMVFQYPEYQLFEEVVYDDIAFGPKNMGLKDEEIERRVKDSAKAVGLSEELLKACPFDLSGGQKRRVAIAGILAMEPKVLVLDEPTAGLDPEGRHQILSEIRSYHEKTGNTVIIVTHAMEEIAENVDRVFVLSDGKNYMEGTPKEVFARADELLSVGLDIPMSTKIAMALKDRGVKIDSACYTIEDLAKQLTSLKGGKR